MVDNIQNRNSFRFNRKVVGKGSKVKRDSVELGKVTKKVHNAIMSVFDTYFACKYNEYTIKLIGFLENIVTKMVAHFMILWNLKQAIMYEFPRVALMGKIHAAQHISNHINQFGPILFFYTTLKKTMIFQNAK